MKPLKILIACLFILFLFLNQVHFYQDDLTQETIKVEVKGYIEKEEIVILKAYSTYDDLLEMLELYEDTDMSKINRLQVLKNDDVIVLEKLIPKYLVSINAASEDELCTIKGIGPSLARRIIEDRNINGSFISLEDLKRVKGIGDKKFESIKEYIRL